MAELKEREITNIDEIDKFLSGARVCRIALKGKEFPYIIPMLFGYNLTGGKLEMYFRCEIKGKKTELLKENNEAAFEIDVLYDVIKDEKICGYEAVYKSMTGIGTIEFITGVDKITGLSRINQKYGRLSPETKISEQLLNSFAILKLTADEFCCKEHNYS